MDDGGAVLVVEDDADVLRSARLALTAAGSRVDTLQSADGLEAHLREFDYDVLLLDMNFVAGERSGAGGLSALARVRKFDPTLAVVLMTAYGGVTLAVEALKQGAVDFILKPWRNEKLVAAVMAAAQMTRSRRGADTLPLDVLERDAIERALSRYDHNISLTAAALGLSRAALYRRMAKYGFQARQR
jgi:two-component system response regulator RegA